MTKRKIPLIKTDERTAGGRVYTKQSITSALRRILWDTYVPLSGVDRSGVKKEYSYLKKPDFIFEEDKGILYVMIDETIIPRILGMSLAPYIYVENVRPKKDEAIITDFTFNGVHAVQDLCSFTSIDSTVK